MIPYTMRAAVCDAPGAPLVIREIPVPTPGNGQLLVKLESCGICHSDLHIRNGDENLPAELYPLTLGHEGIGRIVAIGEGTDTNLPLGVRVGLPWLYDTCLQCDPCLTGSETFCPHQHARGIDRPGAFAEYALVDARFASVIPDAIDPVRGAPLLCAGLTAWSALDKTLYGRDKSVLIVGAGGLGQYAIRIAKAKGAKVIAVDSDATKLDEARRLGADETVRAGPDAGTEIKQRGGADIVVNFAPSAKVWSTIEAAVNPMSEIVLVGLVHEPMPLSTMWLINGGHILLGSSVGTRNELSEFLDYARQHPFDLSVETVPLSGVNAALDRLAAGTVKGRLCVDFALG